jgi:hypothetical protein
MLKVCSFSIEPNNWTTIISVNLMNFKSLWLRNRDQKTLHHILVRGLKSFSSCKTSSELCPMVNLKKKFVQI